MNTEQILLQTAEAFEDHLIVGRDYSYNPFHDLQQLTKHFKIQPGKPGTMALSLVNKAIKEFEKEDALDVEVELVSFPSKEDAMHSSDLNALKNWVETTFHDHELVMMDVILCAAWIKNSTKQILETQEI